MTNMNDKYSFLCVMTDSSADPTAAHVGTDTGPGPNFAYFNRIESTMT